MALNEAVQRDDCDATNLLRTQADKKRDESPVALTLSDNLIKNVDAFLYDFKDRVEASDLPPPSAPEPENRLRLLRHRRLPRTIPPTPCRLTWIATKTIHPIEARLLYHPMITRTSNYLRSEVQPRSLTRPALPPLTLPAPSPQTTTAHIDLTSFPHPPPPTTQPQHSPNPTRQALTRSAIAAPASLRCPFNSYRKRRDPQADFAF